MDVKEQNKIVHRMSFLIQGPLLRRKAVSHAFHITYTLHIYLSHSEQSKAILYYFRVNQ